MANQSNASVKLVVQDLMRSLDLTTVFGNPGSTELAFLHDWPSDFEYVLGLQESVVVAMADGYAQANGGAALVNLHSAAGVGHAMGSIYTAFRNQTPLIITAGQQSRDLLPYRPFLGSTQATELAKPYIKWSCEPARAEDVPLALAQAYHISMQRPRGPVFLSIPSDDWNREAPSVSSVRKSYEIAPDPDAIDKVCKALQMSSSVALVLGAGIGRDRSRQMAVALAECLACDVFNAPIPSRSTFDENHPLYRGVLPAVPGPLFTRLAAYETILVIGAPAFALHVSGDLTGLRTASPIYHITDDPDSAAAAFAAHSMVCSPVLALEALLARLPQRREAPMLAASHYRADEPAASALTAATVFCLLDHLLPDNCAVVEEAPSHKDAMQAHLPFGLQREYFAMASGGLGFALPAAAGIARSGCFARTICIVGDGSIMYSIQALHAVAEARLPIVILVLNNGGYGAMRAFSKLMNGCNAPGIDLVGLNLVQIAAGHGVPGKRIETVDDLKTELANAITGEQPVLLDIAVDAGVTSLYGVD